MILQKGTEWLQGAGKVVKQKMLTTQTKILLLQTTDNIVFSIT